MSIPDLIVQLSNELVALEQKHTTDLLAGVTDADSPLSDVERINLRALGDQILRMTYRSIIGDGETAEFERWLAQTGVIRPDGTFSEQHARLELFDYMNIIGDVGKVYWHVTNGMVSKPNTRASAVIQVADEIRELQIAEALADANSEGE